MSAPLASFNVKLIPNVPHPIDSDFGVKITLASVDPERMSEGSYACLRMLKDDFDEEFDEDFDSDDEEQEDDDEEEQDAEDAEEEEKDEEDVEDDEDQEIHDEEDEDDEEGEYVVCTLTDKQFQQSLDLFVSADKETVFLVATGEAPIYVSGYYVDTFGDDYSDEDDEDDEEDEDDSEDEYDLTPDEDEILEEGDFDIEDLEDDENVQEKIQELIAKDEKKSNKRSIADVEAEEAEAEEAEEEPKLTKKQKKAAAAAAKKEADEKAAAAKKEAEEKAAAAKKEAEEKAAAAKKEVKFNKELEGPSKPKVTTKTLAGGVVIEDRTVGKGPAAKSGSKVGVRYIGKLKNGSIFDKNTSGKPFNFNLGKGEVIKGWDIGVVGMAVGGERRIVIPAPFAYGKKKLPGIPANSELTFDVKLVSLK